MSSQDTTSMAMSEEEDAKVLQHEIDKEQADIAALQKDINSKSQVISGLQAKEQQHMHDAQRLRQQAMDEQKREQEEQAREQQEGGDDLMKKAVKESTGGF